MWISGPHQAGKHDMTIFWDQLKGMLEPGDVAIADCGYQTSSANKQFMSTPNVHDNPKVAKFKSIVRCCHETFNGRLKMYASLENC